MVNVGETWIRILVSVVFVPCIIIICWMAGISLFVFITLIILFGLREYHGIATAKNAYPNWFIGIPAAFLLCLDAWLEKGAHIPQIITALVFLTAAAEVFRNSPHSPFQNIAATILGILNIGLLGSHLILLSEWQIDNLKITKVGGEAIGPVILAFAIPWSYDSFAYFTGKSFGRHRLLPRVSRGKTIEGAIGGLLGALIVMFILRLTLFPFLTPFDCVILGAAGGIISQVGDLAESLMKRDAELKDSSNIIPGHGGILDRFDSVFFAAPFVFYYQLYFVS